MSKFASVLISTRNRAHLLERALLSLARQTMKPEQFEIIVVDDGSTDNTAEVCERMHRELPNLRYIPVGAHVEIGLAGNIGIQSARGSLLLFTDDDCIAREDWVERMTVVLEQEPIIAGAIASPTSNHIKLCHNIAQFYPFMPDQKAGPVEFIAGANMGFSRSVLEELNGFGESRQLCEDMELILRARLKGYIAYFAPDAVVTHDPERTILAAVLRYSSEHASETVLLRNEYRSLLRTPFVLRSSTFLLLAAPVIALKVTLSIYLGNSHLIRYFWTAPVVYSLKLAWCWGAARGLRRQKHAQSKNEV